MYKILTTIIIVFLSCFSANATIIDFSGTITFGSANAASAFGNVGLVGNFSAQLIYDDTLTTGDAWDITVTGDPNTTGNTMTSYAYQSLSFNINNYQWTYNGVNTESVYTTIALTDHGPSSGMVDTAEFKGAFPWPVFGGVTTMSSVLKLNGALNTILTSDVSDLVGFPTYYLTDAGYLDMFTNGIANLSDMTIVISEQTVTVAEPSDMLLFGLCLTGLGIACRRKKQRI